MEDLSAASPLAEIGAILESRMDELSHFVLDRIHSAVPFYRDSDVVSDAELLQSATDHFRFVVRALADSSSFDTSPAAATGRARATAGVPRSAVMDAYRVGSHCAWEQMMALSVDQPGLDRDSLLAATARFWEAQDRYTDAMTTAYHEAATHLVVENAAEHAALTEALLQGRPLGEYSRWEVAALLQLPVNGPYAIVATQPSRVGQQPLPGIGPMLRSLDVFSAWRLLPDILIGIIHLPSESVLDSVVALLERATTTAVGISPLFGDLANTAVNLRYARIAMAAREPKDSRVRLFGDSVLAVAVVSAPEVIRKITEVTLGAFLALPPAERLALTETFNAWIDHDGSVSKAAESLFCHANTVRNRLRRVEECTGKTLAVPRDLAELCLAFEAIAHLPDPAGAAAVSEN